MGSPKPLLPFEETTFVEHMLAQFLASRARPVLVILGHEADRIRKEASLDEARVVVNADYREGMLSSIRAGIRALEGESVEGALVCPVDLPGVSTAVIDLVIEEFKKTNAPIVVPVFDGRRGHPVLFAQALFPEILEAPGSVGARQVVWHHAEEVLEVPTEERGIISDIDTPEDYQDLRRKRGPHSS